MAIKYNFRDIKLNNDNDISIADGDIDLCSFDEAFDQHIKMRVLTNKGELPLHQDIGSNIEELEGMPNTRTTGEYGTSKIRQSLDADQTINSQEISVRAVPTSPNEITFYTYAELESGMSKTRVFVDTTFSLANGIFIKK